MMGGVNGVIRIPVKVKADALGTLAALREYIVAVGGKKSHPKQYRRSCRVWYLPP